MTEIGRLVHRLGNITTREIERALRKDGFTLERETPKGARIYYHDDGRIVVIHYHAGSQTFTRKTLKSVIEGAHRTEADLKRLGLIK